MGSDALGSMEGPLAHALGIAEAECRRLGHEFLDTPHFFLGLLQAFPDAIQQLLEPFGVRRNELVEQIRSALLPQGGDAAPLPDLPPTPALLEMVATARSVAGSKPLRFEHVLIAQLRRTDSSPTKVLRELGVDPTTLEAAVLARLTARGGEARQAARQKRGERESVLQQLAHEMVEEARDGAYDPVIGRDHEIESVLETLARRTKNNPVLLGEPGVGKSAIVEGLAQRIAAGAVPERLAGLRIFAISTADLVAGTQFRGDFENRILKLVEECIADPDAVVFIDEIHTILGSGGQAGTADAAALLKPHLARGDLRCIGATTTDEYRKFIERDRALARRFQAIVVPEPSVEECRAILRGIAPAFERHHGVAIPAEAIDAAILLSKKHLPERFLPDKAIDLIDQSCARRVMRQKKGDRQPLAISADDIAALLREQLGKSLGEITLDESEKLLGLESFLKERVIGQDHVARQVAERLLLTKREFDFRPERPSGVFLFLGPTGVGKTEVARALAEYLLGSQQKLLRYDLSEFSESHSIAKIIGSPPGYVGYEDEGHQLTSKVRSNPQAILLLDEIEKAHPAVLNLFLQVFEDGRLTDARGRTVSFSEITIILTSNIGSDSFRRRESIGFVKQADLPPDQVREQAKEILKDRLPLELINRVDAVLVFDSLNEEVVVRIAERLVLRVVARFAAERRTIEVKPSAVRFLGESGYDPNFGARHVQRNVEQLLLQPLAHETYLSDWSRVERIVVAKVGSALQFERVLRPVAAAQKGRRVATTAGGDGESTAAGG